MNKDGPVRTSQFENTNKLIKYLDENDFKQKERTLKKYCMNAYKYWNFDVLPKLKQTNKKDGQYELELPVSKLFIKVYGEVKVLFSVKNDVVILETIVPDEILTAMYRKELPTYKGVPYRNDRDKFKIELLKE